jgi:serine/threonine-protein kinase HipA
MARQLDVLLGGSMVGRLREEDDLWAFEYTPQWAASAEGFDLAPGLPRTQLVHADGASRRPVQWYFDNLLPEEALRTLLARDANLPSEDAFGLLAHFGAESAGALVLNDPLHAVPTRQGVQPLALAELSRRIAELPRVPLTHNAPQKMSLAGAQHKMLVVVRGRDLFEPLPGSPSTHILKPNHPDADYAASVMNEYFTMRLARAAGLQVAEVLRSYVPQPVYLVARFDRVAVSGAEEVRRRHIIDTCQLLGKPRNFKYTAARLETLSEAIGLCRARAAARLQLYRWLVFNLLIGNGDNHIKNISFLVDASGIHLAPAYDLLSTAVYDTQAFADERARWPATALAFSLGDATSFGSVTRVHVLEAGRALGLAQATAQRELDRLVKELPVLADRLSQEISETTEQEIAASPDPQAARTFIGGEMRLLRAIRHIVLPQMVRQLA